MAGATSTEGSVTSPAVRPAVPGILHLGLGNFHRAHQALYTAAALDAEPGPWGIVGAANASRRVVEALRAQDGRYTVLTLGPDGVRSEIVTVHTGFLVAADQVQQLLDHLADPRIRVVTLTVTENGYGYSPRTGDLDVDDERVRADLAGDAPTTTIGRLARGLQRRFRRGGEPLSVVSCDNLQHNGERTGTLVRRFLELADEADGSELLAWLDARVTFPSTMVDRIVPATEDAHRDQALAATGMHDRVPVPAEPFSMWVLEDAFAGGRPTWEAGGAVLTDDVTAYELLKLRVLNASNSMLAYLGLLSGERYIADALALPGVAPVVDHLVRAEMLPTLRVPTTIDIETYLGDLFDRFGNRAVAHRTAQVGSDGSLKLPVRVSEPVLHHVGAGQPPSAIALLVAAFLRCLTEPESAYPAEVTGTPADPRAEALAALGRHHRGSAALVRAVFDTTDIFPIAVCEATPFVDRVTELHDALRRGGPAAAIAEVLR
jgi:fructuronate reductase